MPRHESKPRPRRLGRDDRDLRRYPTAEALGVDLADYLAGGGPTERRSGPQAETRRVLTLAFVRLSERIDALDEGGAARLAAHVEQVQGCIAESDGVELGADAGEFCVSFEAPSAAVAFGLRLHAGRSPELPRVRVGVHLGEVSLRSESTEGLRVVGSAVDRVRRLSELAQPDQLLVSAIVFNEARAYLRGEGSEHIAWRAYGPYRYGAASDSDAEHIEVCEVGYPSVAPLEPPPDTLDLVRSVQPGHEAVLGWRPAGGLKVPKRPNWTLAKKLGEGGFGEVWLATHVTTRDQRAFKFCFHADRLRQLKREVILFSVLRDTLDKRWDIAQILDWQFEEAPFFIESEYSPDGSFLDWAHAQGGLEEIPFEQRLELVAQVADALGAAHGVGVLHKDVKPSNVLIKNYGAACTAQLADFGVGVVASGEGRTTEIRAASRKITKAGLTEVWGQESTAFSHLYVAPELLEGQAATKRSDIYALGILLYQVIRADFSKALGPGWERYVDDPLLREDIAACVDSDPERRLESAEELALRLRSQEERGVEREENERQAQHPHLLERHEELVRQRKRWLAAVLVLAALALWSFVTLHASEAEVQRLRQRVQELEAD